MIVSLLKSIFRRDEPDILDSLNTLKDIEDVADFCLFDEEGKVLRTGSESGNAKSHFASLGIDTVRISLLLSEFTKWSDIESRFWHLQCTAGSLLVWNFGASHLIVLLKGTRQIPIVRMTVNIFKNTVMENKTAAKYIRGSEAQSADVWSNNAELRNLIDFVLGNQVEEKEKT